MTLSLTRRGLAGLALAGALTAALPGLAQTSGDPVLIGVSGPLTGPQAQYGAQWKQGFDLALDKINAAGGINGRPLAYEFEDSQGDPRQAIAIAQKFIADPRIVVEFGDFSSTTSMAASPLYQRGGLVQFGLTNSHPDFTKTGDYMWSNTVPQSQEQPLVADFAMNTLGFKKFAVLHLNTDWGTTAKNLFVEAVKADGGEVVAVEGYLPDEKDFRATLTKVRATNPQAIMLESYYSDGALIVRQMREMGIDLPVVAVGSVYSPDFLSLAGDAAEGVYTTAYFIADSPRPEVQEFVSTFEAKYDAMPNSFNAMAYDTMNTLAEVMRRYGTTREDIKSGLGQISGISSVMFPRVSFDPETRRVSGPEVTGLVVKDGAFQIYKP
ncbi:MAG: ABC transporter substrate-binding protein [Rhodovulum sulfidophilum]|uniref:ABC transporter substrate-binding protein n=1 Tax=Rhodovulum sulfidophilum TaxID=35806 RepID=A0A2W5N493_RHOSU|nr:MAG: ABC transporter substrate-binding protein [Rhodovulum sulfidophilum]